MPKRDERSTERREICSMDLFCYVGDPVGATPVCRWQEVFRAVTPAGGLWPAYGSCSVCRIEGLGRFCSLMSPTLLEVVLSMMNSSCSMQ